MRERDLLQHIYRANTALPPRVTIPPGDDMGALRLGDREVLVTVDQVADGVHVNLSTTPLAQVGRKAITRNLSDVAAMAAVPLGAVVAAALPQGFGQQRADELFDAMRAVAAAYDCPLFGGDVTIWKNPLLLTVTVLAESAGIAPVRRSGARSGDVICVTGRLGGSLETVTPPGSSTPYTHHLDFEPRLHLARQLAGDPALHVHCLIDLSDGLASDLRHLCAASGVSAEIWANRLPLSAAAHAAAERDHQPAWRHALNDGEDYELCFTLPAGDAERALPREVDGVPITQIGLISGTDDRAKSGADPTILLKMPDGSIESLSAIGWEHRD